MRCSVVFPKLCERRELHRPEHVHVCVWLDGDDVQCSGMQQCLRQWKLLRSQYVCVLHRMDGTHLQYCNLYRVCQWQLHRPQHVLLHGRLVWQHLQYVVVLAKLRSWCLHSFQYVHV